MRRALVFFLAILLGAACFTWAQERTSIMFIVGCLAQENDTWILTNASDPTPVMGAPGSKTENEPLADAPLGTNRFRLVGTVQEFGVDKLKGHKVRVKGLVMKAVPESRVNLTSLRMLGTGCQ